MTNKKISNETVFLLDERNLLKSQQVEELKKASQSTTYYNFLNIVREKLSNIDFILLPNDYPYDLYCGDDLEHFVLWFRTNLTESELQKIIDNIPNLHSYWNNLPQIKSLPDPEIDHIQIFIKKI